MTFFQFLIVIGFLEGKKTYVNKHPVKKHSVTHAFCDKLLLVATAELSHL